MREYEYFSSMYGSAYMLHFNEPRKPAVTWTSLPWISNSTAAQHPTSVVPPLFPQAIESLSCQPPPLGPFGEGRVSRLLLRPPQNLAPVLHLPASQYQSHAYVLLRQWRLCFQSQGARRRMLTPRQGWNVVYGQGWLSVCKPCRAMILTAGSTRSAVGTLDHMRR